MSLTDPRISPWRPDLAHAGLEGEVAALAYVEPVRMQVNAAVLSIRARPEADARQDDQLVFGETFDLIEEADGWGWGQARRDGYVGYVDMAGLSQPVLTPTHRVSALRTYAYAEPSAKSQPVMLISLNALVTAEAEDGAFVRIARAGYVARAHLSALDRFETDAVAVAERFIGAPYQWGGRESLGLDCSGLVQQALYACGLGCPRDSDMQARALGRTVEGQPRRGDLIFWDGHVALMRDADHVIHADGHNLAVTVEPLAAVTARFAAEGQAGPKAIRRL